eukprot:symbB.v1.2.009896.t1/scaffold639.1/size181572/17
MARWSRALGAARRAVHLAVVPAPASPCYALNSLAAAGIVLGSSLVACKEKKKNKVPEIKEISTGQLGKLMMLIHDGTFCQCMSWVGRTLDLFALRPCQEEKPEKKQLAPGFKPGEPEIKFAEVQKHNSVDKGIWVTYRDGVFDITKFVQNHPGGLERILKAAGGQIDPFWAMYAQHNVASVKDILGEHRIGHLSEHEYKNLPPPFDPYQTDPKRDPELVVQAAKPFNAECPLSQLAKQEYLTPNEKFFVRNHLPVPTGDLVDPKKFVLEITPGEDQSPVKLTLADLQDRREDMHWC